MAPAQGKISLGGISYATKIQPWRIQCGRNPLELQGSEWWCYPGMQETWDRFKVGCFVARNIFRAGKWDQQFLFNKVSCRLIRASSPADRQHKYQEFPSSAFCPLLLPSHQRLGIGVESGLPWEQFDVLSSSHLTVWISNCLNWFERTLHCTSTGLNQAIECAINLFMRINLSIQRISPINSAHSDPSLQKYQLPLLPWNFFLYLWNTIFIKINL